MLSVLFDKIGDKAYQHKWIQVVIISWILVTVFAFILMVIAWTMSPDELVKADWLWILMVTPFILSFLITVVPVLIVLFHPHLRSQIYTSPMIGAVSLLVFSFLLSFMLLISIEVICRSMEIESLFYIRDYSGYNSLWVGVFMAILTGFFIGIIAFSLTFGIVFPLAIPIVCSVIVSEIIHENHNISCKAWGILMFGATLGWGLVSVVGYALGNA